MTKLKTLGLLLSAAMLASCGTSSIQDITGPLAGARIRFFNFGINAPSVNFYANGTKMSATSSTTGVEATTGVSYGSVSALDFTTIAYSGAGVPLWTNRYNGPVNSYDSATAIGDHAAIHAVQGIGNHRGIHHVLDSHHLLEEGIGIVLGVMVVFGAVGWADDWIKIRYKDNKGLPARKKFFWTSIASLGAGIALYVIAAQQTNPVHSAGMLDLLIPFFKLKRMTESIANFVISDQ